jgi:leucyl aminopeptidase
MKLTLNNKTPHAVESACIVVGVFEDEPLGGAAADLDEASSGAISAMIESGDIDAFRGRTTLLHGLPGVKADRILVTGLGELDRFDRVRFDMACMSAGAFLREHSVTEAHICLHESECEDLDLAWRLRHAGIAFDRANYVYTTTKPRKDDSPHPLKSVSFQGDAYLEDAIRQAESIAAGYRRARELGNLPPNICNPAYLAQQAKSIAEAHKRVDVEILKKKDMAALGMDALLAVGQGSENGPRLIVLKYNGAGDEEQPVALVGKGITFDSGGISLKPGANMDQMKFDMCGAATVLGAFEACVLLNLPINLVTIVAAAENMPDGRAYRPGDVLTSMSGKTIEILNTDAEGRLVLCDALTYCERFNPRATIDVATLTGACVVALGHHASGLMSPHDDLAEELIGAGRVSVDRAWRLPIWEDYQQQLKTPFADMKNVGGMPAGAITAGCFLSRFAKKQRWAHIDIAGSAWKWGEAEGATGRPVGLLTHYLINQS